MMQLQIASVVFSLFMLYVVTIHRRKRHLDLMEYLWWISIWVGFIGIVMWPNVFRDLAQNLQIDRLFDLIVIFALIIVMVLTFYNRIAYLQLREKVEKLVRERAKESRGKES